MCQKWLLNVNVMQQMCSKLSASACKKHLRRAYFKPITYILVHKVVI